MLVLSRPDNITICMPTSTVFSGVPVIDLSDSNAKSLLVNACIEVGFFKVTNHGISMEFLRRMEAEAADFFQLSKREKEQSVGYGSNNIGSNGDVGWIEYLLFSANSTTSSSIPGGIPHTLWGMVKEYVGAMRDMACLVVEMMTEEIGFEEKEIVSKMLRDEKSDSCFRVNHYPSCPQAFRGGRRSLIGFGEHTDPQIISVLRSNNASGLQICLADGTWVSIPSDPTTFFFNVGDTLQVITNGRFRSVKHRVLADTTTERLSMIYFGGPPLAHNIKPLWINDGEESIYREFTWSEYKMSAYKTRLSDNRLALFEKSSSAH